MEEKTKGMCILCMCVCMDVSVYYVEDMSDSQDDDMGVSNFQIVSA